MNNVRYAPGNRVLYGERNPQASIVIILDNPGARENKEGEEYVCGTRQTLQKGIYDANLKPEDIYITYLLKCRPLRKYDKKRARQFSMPYLVRQIESIRPRFLVCLGDTVVQAVFGDNEAHVKNLWGSWHTVMSCPQWYIIFYNHERPHQSLDYQPPIEFYRQLPTNDKSA